MNFLPALREGDRIAVPGTSLAVAAPPGLPESGLTLGFRPEHVMLSAEDGQIFGQVGRLWFEGLDEIVALSHPAGELRLRCPAGQRLEHGDRIGIKLREGALRLYSNGCLVA
jgi:glycerol transport system ATP-binding protein